jgi:hypothetical protein
MTTSKTSRKKAGSLLSGRFKSQRTSQVDSAFAERTRQLEERAQQLDPQVVVHPVASLRLDGGTQPRVSTDASLVETYAERMIWSEKLGQVVDQEGHPFEPITFYDDGEGSHWLADGFHRVLAARKLGLEGFQAKRLEGSQHAAFVYSLGANATHGKRRSNADKRRAVERALSTVALRKLTDRRLATICKVSNRFVSTVRGELEASGEIPFEVELEKADGSVYERLDEPPSPRFVPHVKPPRKRASRKKGSLGDALSVTTCAVAFATSPKELARQLRACGQKLSCYEMLLAPYPADIKTLQELDAVVRSKIDASWHGPWPVYIRDHDRIYVMWSIQGSMPVSTTTAQLGEMGPIEVWGTATEPWS